MIRRFRNSLVCAILAFAAGQSVAAQTDAKPQAVHRTVYRGATLIDGTGARPRANMAVVVRGEQIEAVVEARKLTPKIVQGAEMVDLRGRYLLPGLIDAHQHLATPPDRRRAEAVMRRQLFSGITAERIMADDLRSIAELARASRAGEIDGPDLYFAALVAGPGFFTDPRTSAAAAGWGPGEAPWMQAIDERTDLPLAIARARGTGAHALKIYADLPPPLVKALTLEAHRQKLPVWVHGMVFPTRPADVIAAGPDVVSHTCYLGYQLVASPPATYRERSPIDPALFGSGDHPAITAMFDTMRERGIILDATLRVYQEVERRSAAAGQQPYCTLDLAARLTAQAHRQGVLIAAGTDGETPAGAAYPSLFDELELLVARAGLTPLEAIRSATQIAAMAMNEGSTQGVIAPGYLANMVVLERDPIRDIRNTRSVTMTVKRGRRFSRADYQPVTSDEMDDQ